MAGLSQPSPATGLVALRRQSQAQTGQGSCTDTESRTAFDNCIFSFGMGHRQHFQLLQRNAPKCRSEVFNCREVDVMMRCLNTQPTTVISNRCWVTIPNELTKALKRYDIPCTYDDIAQRCGNGFTPLIPVARRRTSGRGIRNNPMAAIMNRIFPMIAMSMMGGGGLLGGMGGALGF
ncbi:hypothetical protein V1264_025067 [Littorina saxatilis]|uniref:Uncharacterized protein n=1 Tax=Littorina saxatilis TaxID=31220 RepID=A0AAN9FZ09_9CAEN